MKGGRKEVDSVGCGSHNDVLHLCAHKNWKIVDGEVVEGWERYALMWREGKGRGEVGGGVQPELAEGTLELVGINSTCCSVF